MESIKNAAKAIQAELVKIRRELHQRAEVGFDLPQTLDFIQNTLRSYGYTPEKCGRAGWLVCVGKTEGKTVLLRADIDGLPIFEETGVSYACTNGQMHACGHDMHAAMLLGAAKLLKEREKELNGCVKLLFQPAEELLEGAKDVISAGVLDDPKPQAAMMLHVLTNTPFPTGTVVVASKGVSAPAADFFSIKVQGKGCHGAAPWNGVDALSVGARILLGLEELSARELSVANSAVLTVGQIETAGASNAIADRVTLKGTLRAFDEKVRSTVKKRMETIAKNIAKAFRARAEIIYHGGCPTLLNDGKVSALAEKTLKTTLGAEMVYTSDGLSGDVRANSGGSEDFAYISHKIPSVMAAIAAGQTGKGYDYPLHHPKASFDEAALSIGCTAYASFALAWVSTNK